MNYLTLENVTKFYGDKMLFDDISFFVDRGHKTAFVAKNGTGKSTLLKVITGVEPVDGEKGKVLLNKNISIGFLEQEPEFQPGQTILEAVLDSDNPILSVLKEYQNALLENKPEKIEAASAKMDNLEAWDVEVRLKQILTRFNVGQLDQQVDILSGGQKKRIALAKVLISEPDFLILDEPTNHLDLDMVEWLEKYLQREKLTVFMVTHDRYFLDRVCNQIVELDNGKIYRYKGNYTYYLEKKAMRQEIEERTRDRDKKTLSNELEWIRRMPKARGTKSKARVDQFYALKEKIGKHIKEEKISFDIIQNRLGKKIVEFYNVKKAYGDFKILENFNYKFTKGERVGIVGVNGAGKSTFLNILTGADEPDSGRVVVGETVLFGHYTQDGLPLRDDKRVIEVVREIADVILLNGGRKMTAKQMLERFLFPAEQHRLYVSALSGGEKRRLYLLTVLLKNPNFLILDEPTNDLDILTLNVLEEFLLEFEGCLVIVSHDRYFMDKLVDHLFVFKGEGEIKDYNGNYTIYRQILKEEKQNQEKPAVAKAPEKQKPKSTQQKLSYKEKVEFEQLEKDIEKMEARRTEINEKFNDPSLTPEKIKEISIELNQIQESLDEKEMRWMELADKI